MSKLNKETIAEIGTKFAELGDLFSLLSQEEGTTAPKTEKTSKKTPKEVAPVVEETEEDEDGVLTEEDLQEMELKELKVLADDNGIEYTKSVKKQPLIKLILASMEEEEEVEEEDEDGEEEEELNTIVPTEDGDVDLSEMTLAKLKKFAKEYEIELESKDKDGVIAEIVEAFEEGEEEDEDAEYEDGEEEAEEVDVDEMSLEELAEFAEENEIELPKKKKNEKAGAYLKRVREAVSEALEEAEGDEDEDGDEEEETDLAEELGLNDMDVEELAEYLAEHELSTKGKKQALIARIVKAVEDGVIEVDEEEEGE